MLCGDQRPPGTVEWALQKWIGFELSVCLRSAIERDGYYRAEVSAHSSVARRIIVLGDGARWICAIVEEHFPAAIQIVDLYHAREHLEKVARLLFEAKGVAYQTWISARRDELDAGQFEELSPRWTDGAYGFAQK